MNTESQKIMQYMNRKKKIGITYLLLFLFGIFGAHRFYLANEDDGCIDLRIAFAQLGVIIAVFFLIILQTGWGFLLFIGLSCWLFVELFLMPAAVKTANFRLMSQLGIDPNKANVLA